MPTHDHLSLMRADCQHDADVDEWHRALDDFVCDTHSKKQLVDKIAAALMHKDKPYLFAVLGKHSPLDWTDIAEGFKDSLR